MWYLSYGRQVYFHWICGSLWWIHMVLLTPNYVEIQCFGLMFSTANQWQVRKKLDFFHHHCRYLNQSWSAHRYDTVISAGQVSREIMQGKLLKGCHPQLMTYFTEKNHNIWDCSEAWGRLLLAKIIGCYIPCFLNQWLTPCQTQLGMLTQDGSTRLYWLKWLIKICMASVQLNVIKR